MNSRHAVTTISIFALLSVALAAAQPPAATAGHPTPLPAELEIELALSALPPHLRDNATVYRLDTSRGFALVRQGTNGFHAFVSRNDPNAFLGVWPYTEYRNDILVPIAFDDAGSRAHMRVFFDMAEMQATGTPARELKIIVKQRYANGHYAAPERAGISYMLSPLLRTYQNAEESDEILTVNVPHYMFYAPGVTDKEIGGNFQSSYPFMLNRAAGPHGYIIQLAGRYETQEINAEYAEMLEQLCELRESYCLVGAN